MGDRQPAGVCSLACNVPGPGYYPKSAWPGYEKLEGQAMTLAPCGCYSLKHLGLLTSIGVVWMVAPVSSLKWLGRSCIPSWGTLLDETTF